MKRYTDTKRENIMRYPQKKQRTKDTQRTLVTRGNASQATVRNHDAPPSRPSTIKQTKQHQSKCFCGQEKLGTLHNGLEVPDHTTTWKSLEIS